MCKFHNKQPCPICAGFDLYAPSLEKQLERTRGAMNDRSEYASAAKMDVIYSLHADLLRTLIDEKVRSMRDSGLTGTRIGTHVEEKL